MNTPAHLLVGLAAFGKVNRPRVNAAALAGAFTPDASLYIMTAVSIWGMGIPAQRVFRELYYSDAWQAVFAVDNSAILWGIGLLIAVWRRAAAAVAFAAAGLLHIALDFPLHTHDGRAHFWPVTNWIFESPVSYWDNSAHAGIVGPVVVALCVGAAVLIWWRGHGWTMKIGALVLLLAETFSSGVWRFVF